ncbi:MAG: hypothetical protein OES24_22185 [Acidimicrobiia bacterium]|nr:hypothetical protein [Acidimicrobiia bacterium]
MSPMRLVWWRYMMDLRPVVRYIAEQSRPLQRQAVRARVVAHLLVGNPHQMIIAFYGLAMWDVYDSFPAGLVAWVSMVVAVEMVLQFVRMRGTSPTLLLLVGWREAWRVRRRWPSDWAVVAAKTMNVQAEVGTSEEPKAPPFRPVCDHPKMSWIPHIEWPVITWWVGPPPGRSFQALEATTSILAANISHCQQVRVEFARASDSYGRLIMVFDEIDLRPDWLPPIGGDPRPDADIGGPDTGGPWGGPDSEPTPAPPPLRLVPEGAVPTVSSPVSSPADRPEPVDPDPVHQPNRTTRAAAPKRCTARRSMS